jgi:hypothetical protein
MFKVFAQQMTSAGERLVTAKLLKGFTALMLVALLSGCFVAERSLMDGEHSDMSSKFPRGFEIQFHIGLQDDMDGAVFYRDTESVFRRQTDQRQTIRIKDYGEGYYLVELAYGIEQPYFTYFLAIEIETNRFNLISGSAPTLEASLAQLESVVRRGAGTLKQQSAFDTLERNVTFSEDGLRAGFETFDALETAFLLGRGYGVEPPMKEGVGLSRQTVVDLFPLR